MSIIKYQTKQRRKILKSSSQRKHQTTQLHSDVKPKRKKRSGDNTTKPPHKKKPIQVEPYVEKIETNNNDDQEKRHRMLIKRTSTVSWESAISAAIPEPTDTEEHKHHGNNTDSNHEVHSRAASTSRSSSSTHKPMWQRTAQSLKDTTKSKYAKTYLVDMYTRKRSASLNAACVDDDRSSLPLECTRPQTTPMIRSGAPLNDARTAHPTHIDTNPPLKRPLSQQERTIHRPTVRKFSQNSLNSKSLDGLRTDNEPSGPKIPTGKNAWR